MKERKGKERKDEGKMKERKGKERKGKGKGKGNASILLFTHADVVRFLASIRPIETSTMPPKKKAKLVYPLLQRGSHTSGLGLGLRR